MSAERVVAYLWSVAGVVWIVGALGTKPTARSQTSGSRLFHITLGVLAFAIGFSRPFQFGLLAQPFVPASRAMASTGAVLTLAGIGFAVWGRICLGGNWSGTVTVKENHTLVTRGPYAIVRHPIYSGALLAVLGTAIAYRELRGLVAFGLVFAMLFLKVRMEERLMLDQFGPLYREYRRCVKALIPFVY